jgi:hypothetical protein
MTTPRILECSLPQPRRGYRPCRPGRTVSPQPAVSPGRVPRISRLMALALRLEELVRTGVVADYAALARLGHVSRARISQIQNLLTLAPDIQEALLFLPRVKRGRDPIHLRQLQPVAAILDWNQQRRLWQALVGNPEALRSG